MVSVAVIVITMVVPSVILGIICWFFWRASRRDRMEHGETTGGNPRSS